MIRYLIPITKKAIRLIRREGFAGVKRKIAYFAQMQDVVPAAAGPAIQPDDLQAAMNRVHTLPEVAVDPSRPFTINILVPAFSFDSISAGFFGVFQTALLFAREGYHTRLVLFDRFDFNAARAREKLKNYPGLETLFDELEFIYIGDRKAPLCVSPYDTSLATVWYSAYLARKIQAATCGNPFFYLIQDYETLFYPGSSNALLANQTYQFNYHALFSTAALQTFFTQYQISGFSAQERSYIHYENACSCRLPDKETFLRIHAAAKKRKLVFYSRPVVNRNMYEFGAYALSEAVRRGILPESEWEFIGIGLGNGTVQLKEGVTLRQMPRMNLKEYLDTVPQFDLAITFMASPHPSMLPFDLAGSGCVVVTNNFLNKTQAYFNEVSANILSSDVELEAVLETIARAAVQAENLDARYQNARAMRYPKSWQETWNPEIKSWLHQRMDNMARS